MLSKIQIMEKLNLNASNKMLVLYFQLKYKKEIKATLNHRIKAKSKSLTSY